MGDPTPLREQVRTLRLAASSEPETTQAPTGPATAFDRLFGAVLMTRDEDLLALARAASAERFTAVRDAEAERDRLRETLTQAEAWIAKEKAKHHKSRDAYRKAHPDRHRKQARESMARTRARRLAAAPEPDRG